MRQAVGQVSDRRNAADRLDRAVFFHLFDDQDGVDLLRLFKERNHRIVHTAIQRRVKIFGFEVLDGLRDQGVVEQNGSENYALRIFAAWQRPFEILFAPAVRKR